MKKLFAIIIFSLLPMTSIFAVKVTNLYQAEIPVSSQSPEERSTAEKSGLLQVLTKVSGDPQISKNSTIKDALNRADYFVQEFTYSSATTNSAQYNIVITYEKNDINKLLHRANIGYWGENRPLLLIWLTMSDHQHSTQIIGSEAPGNILETIQLQSKNAGLPLIFPMMDMADITQVTPDDVTKPDLDVLKEAGKRYSPDGLLIGNIQETPLGFTSQWHMIIGGNQWDWQLENKTSDALVNGLLDQIRQTLVKRYVEKPANPKMWLTLEVSNIDQRTDLVQLIQYLKQLSLVQQVQLSQVSGSTVELSVLIQGSLTSFQQNASVGQHLIEKDNGGDVNKLVYDWVR